MSPEPHLALASARDQHTFADWQSAAAAVLRRAGRMTQDEPDDLAWQRLARQTLDGVTVPPLGTAALVSGLATSGRPSRAGAWDVRSQVSGEAAPAVRDACLTDLRGGVTSLWLGVPSPVGAAELGAWLDQALDGVLLDVAPVVLQAPALPVAAATAFLDLVQRREVRCAPGTNLGADPVAVLLHAGAVADPAGQLVSVARLAHAAGTGGVVVDATAVHDLGASDAQELGYSLAVGASYLRWLTQAGFSLDEALALIEFRYAATDEQFPTIAKLRAARRVWRRVVQLSGGTHDEQRQHVVTSRPMMSKYDPWVNMLRTCVAAFAAGVGGADAVTVLPFDSPLGRPDDFGRRIARNTSALLMAEAHVDLVADPAGGAYAVEKLTDDIAAAAWAEFGRIEQAGGILAALDDASLTSRLAATAAQRQREVAYRQRPITGLSEFPAAGEVLPVRPPDPETATVRRYGADFEALRDHPAAQRVFLATLGPVSGHTSRATFASNLFAAGGIDVDQAGATAQAGDLVAAYRAAGQPGVVCLAGPDAAYAQWGAAAVAALREAGASWVILAGRPDSLSGAAASPVDDWCAAGEDALAFLHRTREHLR